MKISDNGINMLKQMEGCVKISGKHVIYDDKTGKPVNTKNPLPMGATVGYGHLIKSGEDFINGIPESVATDLLHSDIAAAELSVNKNICVPINQNQYDALVMFVYNIGAKNFANSTVVKYINNPNFKNDKYPDLKSAWCAWNKYCGQEMLGLTKRRQNEWILFSKGIYKNDLC